MFLKSIEIQGFKSFAHKTVLNFNKGMTAIVGPNGSGKSNIADAVRWVLGEQKVKSLRGASMQDVIFAGTELRKPLGFAFVSMTFDNSDHALNLDYAEVTVSRRLYRSGESEYMINGQNVRLKDIQELFFDTGIGKEGYSIIGQGQIEAIVSGRPEERRGLFDEACGIVKFKKRKQAAVKKLEEQEIDLNRVTDLLNELEKRVGPLEKQSVNAKEYLRLRDDLKKYEVTIFARESEELLQDLEENAKASQISNEQIFSIRQEAAKLKQLNQELADKLAQVEDTLEQGRNESQKGQLLITNIESQISIANNEIASDTSNITRYQEEVEQKKEEKSKKDELLLSYLRSVRALKKEIAAVMQQSEIIGQEFGNEQHMPFIDLSSYEESLTRQIPPELLKTLEDPSKETEVSKNVETDEEDEFEFAEPDWLKAIKHKKDDLTLIGEKSKQLTAWIESAEKEYAVILNELKQKEAKNNELSVHCSTIRSKLDLLKNIAERYEGYGQAVQAVMSLKDKDSGIKGVVADLIHTESRFETAIETALGARIQNIVTDNEATAKRLIEHLKRNRLGRATFLPVDAVKARTQEDHKNVLLESGCLGIASEIVSVDSLYREVIRSLLGSTYVFQTVEQALAAAGKYNHNLRIVTLDGELLSPGGAIAGGAYKNASNLIGRTREISELEQKLNTLIDEKKTITAQISELQTKQNDSDAEIKRLQASLREVNEEKNTLSFGLTGDMKLKISNLQQSVEFMIENIQRVLSESEKDRDDLGRYLELIESCRKHIEQKKQEILDRTEDIAHVRQGIADTERSMSDALKQKEELAKDQSAYFLQKDQLNDETLRLEKELMRLENLKEKLTSKLEVQTDRIWNEYGVSLSDAAGLADPEAGSMASMKAEVSRLTSAIKALGMINIQAIEEYKQVSERYELMKTQHADITKARHEILKIISELDEGMKKQFGEQFANIKNEFQKVFQELFGGGSADLALVYDDETEGPKDELTAGISIIAQPPGKKLQNMMQLSGGEKAFTAIALLFAIQNLKPSPFCLLDEIEAALDDSNVLRFAQYIKRISDRSQFILITHRRGTMENADRLYGITMQEKGVTSLVSVDLVSEQLN